MYLKQILQPHLRGSHDRNWINDLRLLHQLFQGAFSEIRRTNILSNYHKIYSICLNPTFPGGVEISAGTEREES